jgi:hypothetical protein
LMLVGMGNPLGTRNPHGYEFGQNFIPVMGMGFLAGIFFLRGYGFGQVIPSGFLPIAISSGGGGGLRWTIGRWTSVGGFSLGRGTRAVDLESSGGVCDER